MPTSPDQYVVEHPSTIAPALTAIVGCVDANAPAKTDRVLGDSLYYQFAGAGAGIGNVALFGLELQHPGFTERTGAKAHQLGKIVGEGMYQHKQILVVIHESCKAIENGPIINEDIADDDSGMLMRGAMFFEPEVENLDYQRALDAARRITDLHAIAQPTEVYQEMKRDTDDGSAVPSAHLRQSDTPLGGFAYIREPGHAFNVRAANDDGNRWYVATRQLFVDASKVAEAYLGLDPKNFMASAAIFHSGVRAKLELATEQSLPFIGIGEAA